MTIIEEIRHDPERGAKRLERECKPGLLALARRLCNDPGDAEELVNHTLAEAIANIDSLLSQSALFGWMCQILIGCHSKETRRKSNDNVIFDSEALKTAADPGSAARVFRDVDAALLHDAILSLPKEMKDVIVMHFLMEQPVAGVAKFLALPVSTVKWRIHIARAELARRLGATARKPGVKAVLVAVALCALTAAGAAVAGAVAASRNTTHAAPSRSTALLDEGGEETDSLRQISTTSETAGEQTATSGVQTETRQGGSLGELAPSTSGEQSAPSESLSGAALSAPATTTTHQEERNTTMKTLPLLASMSLALAMTASADDYTLPAGQTDTMSTTVTYGTMTISGSLTVNGGATVSASETTLGGDSGDSAGISVSGNGTKFDSQKVTIGGASGGTGTITATQGGVVVIGKTSANENRLTVASGAVPASGDVIDALVLGAGEHRIARLANSSGYPARILFAESGARLAVKTSANNHWVNSFMSGNWILEATAPVEIRLECPPNHTLNDNGSKIITAGSGLFRVAGGSGTSKVAAEFGNTGGVTIDSGIKFTFANGKVDMSGLRGPLTINGTLGAGNNAVYGDGLVVGANGAVTTSSTQDFVFGSGDADGSLSAAIPSSNRVVKVGSGTLTVTGASSAGRLTISNGTVKVSAAFTVGTLELEEGATLVVDDGVDFAPGAIVEHGAATITTLGTGRFIHESDSPCAIAKPSFGGSFVKTGTGTTSIYAPQSMPDALHVAEGGIVFSAYGLSQKYLRWTFSKTATSPNPLHIARLWVFGSDGNRVATGLVEAIENDNIPASSIREGRVGWEYNSETNISASTAQWYYGKGSLYKVFNNDLSTTNQNHYPVLTSPVVDPANSNSWIGFTVHRKSGEANATGYNIKIANPPNAPSSWTVEASDDGATWTLVDSRENLTPAKSDWWALYDGETSAAALAARGAPLQHFLFSGYKCNGLAADTAKAVTLQVDDGASVDLTAFTAAPQKIGGLVVDFDEGGGTVTGGAIGSNGTLSILNGEGNFVFGTPLPLTLSGVSDADNFASWSIFVDGVEVKGRIRIDSNGHPVVVAFGTVVYFR